MSANKPFPSQKEAQLIGRYIQRYQLQCCTFPTSLYARYRTNAHFQHVRLRYYERSSSALNAFVPSDKCVKVSSAKRVRPQRQTCSSLAQNGVRRQRRTCSYGGSSRKMLAANLGDAFDLTFVHFRILAINVVPQKEL